MNPVTWGVLILTFLRSIPDIISLGKTIVEIVKSVEDFLKRKGQVQALNEALKEAHATGDTSKLEALFKRGPDADGVQSPDASPKVGS